MTYIRQIKYDYKIRLDWGKPERRRSKLARGLAKLAVVLAAPVTIVMLGGMASDELLQKHFKVPPWTEMAKHESASAESVFRLPPPTYPPAETAIQSAAIETTTPITPPNDTAASIGNTVAPDESAAPLEPAKASEPTADARSDDSTAQNWQVVKVKSGDNLSLIFSRLGLSAADLDRILSLNDDTAELKNLSPSETLKFRIQDGSLQELVQQVDHQHSLRITRKGDDFTSSMVQEPVETRVRHVSATIEDSLFLSGQKAGLSDAMIMKMAAIFAYDIDFALDLREGDQFTVVYNEIYKDGKKVNDGNIIAAEFVNQGHAYRAVRYVDHDGSADYYAPDGHSLKRAFLRTPVAFTRISSGFSLGRMHPILHKIRAHKGVDYAAPIGTPVKATADGRVAFAGRDGGYGNAIKLKHAGGYMTIYGHLSRYAKGVRAGATVHQGQIIGYVGMTGLATGPHLHYEFRVHGTPRNPLTVKLPKALPIAKAEMADFKAKTQPRLAQLDNAIRVAANSQPATVTASSSDDRQPTPEKVASARTTSP